MSDYLDPNNEELLKDYFVEAEGQIEQLEQNILVLEADTANEDAIDEIFRAAHTLKGASATVQMDELTAFTHVVEDLLDEIRNDKVIVSGELVDALLAGIDVIKEMIECRKEGEIYSDDVEPLKQQLASFVNEKVPAVKAATQAPSASASVPASPAVTKTSEDSGAIHLDENSLAELLENIDSGHTAYEVEVEFDEENPMNTVGGIQVFAALKGMGTVLKTQPDFEQLYEDAFFPTVYYYLSSQNDVDTIKESVYLPDVTLGIQVRKLDAASAKTDKAEPAKNTVAETQSSENEIDDEVANAVKEFSKEQGKDETETERKKKAEKRPQTASNSILRVDSRRIDNLLNLVSETVINKASFNQISNEFGDNLVQLQTTTGQYRETVKELFDSMPAYLQRLENGETIKDIKREIQERFGGMYNLFDGFESDYKTTVAKYRNTAQNLGRITSELQEGVMRIRMVPIGQIFSRFPRLVRDLSRSLNKQIHLDIEGEDTELDKSVIEDLLDPLIHCVRNSIDHGIESPEVRRNAGKPEEGQVKLRASNEGNTILIEVSDDGSGIDVDAVRAKAIDRGVIHPNKVLSDVEAYNLIFDPGFSTAKEITNISGRGVGLDVVKKQIEKLNGSVTVQSGKGKGTKFIIKIPLTLAIIQGLLVRVGSELYAIPITSVIDSHRIQPSDIKMIDNYEVFNVREDVVSLLRLNRLFKIHSPEDKEYFFVVIVGSGDKRMGLVVDQLIGEEDVVIKPLRDHYTNVPGIAGANITGDGTVSLIIDVSQLLDLGMRQEKELRNIRSNRI